MASSPRPPPLLVLTASPRPGKTRPAALAPGHARARYAPSLEEWETKAPLDDAEMRSVGAVREACEGARRLPEHLVTAGTLPPRLETPSLGSSAGAGADTKIQASSRSGTPTTAFPSAGAIARALHPTQAVKTPQQFYDWFSLIERSVAHSQEAHFRAHVAAVAGYLEACDNVLRRVEEVEEEVRGMLERWRGVEEGGRSLKEACERLLSEREELLWVTEEIGDTLAYFKELDGAMRMLNFPGDTLIFQSDFMDMVERVDACIDFLRMHRHFREAELYLLRFQHCMTRAMTLIKMNFVGSLRALSSDVSKRLSEKDLSTTTQHHLLYTRFWSVSSRIAPLIRELEHRARAYPEDLSALLADCHAAYFASRRQLLVPRLMEELRGFDPVRSELVELTRAGCSYLKQLCTDEFNLYRKFFTSAEDRLYEYLETLCNMLYDDLRPRILHEVRLKALCEVCTVLEALMVLDVSALPPLSPTPALSPSPPSSSVPLSAHRSLSHSNVDEDENDDENGDGDMNPLGRLNISRLLQTVLQDAQTRFKKLESK